MRQALSKNEELSVLGFEFGVSVVRGAERLTDWVIGEVGTVYVDKTDYFHRLVTSPGSRLFFGGFTGSFC